MSPSSNATLLKRPTGYLFARDANGYEDDYTLGNQNIQRLVLESERDQRMDELLNLLSNYHVIEQLVHQDFEQVFQDLEHHVQNLDDSDNEASLSSQSLSLMLRRQHLKRNIQLLSALQDVESQQDLDQTQTDVIQGLQELPNTLFYYFAKSSILEMTQPLQDLITNQITQTIAAAPANQSNPSKTARKNSSSGQGNRAKPPQSRSPKSAHRSIETDRSASATIVSDLIKLAISDLVQKFSQQIENLVNLSNLNSIGSEAIQAISETMLQTLDAFCQKLWSDVSEKQKSKGQESQEIYDQAIVAILEHASDHLNLINVILKGKTNTHPDVEEDYIDMIVSVLQDCLLTRIADLLYLCNADTSDSLPLQQFRAIDAIKQRLIGLKSLLARLIADKNRDRSNNNLFILIPAHFSQEESTQETVVKTKGDLIVKDRLTSEDISKDKDSANLLFVPIWASQAETVATLMSLANNPAIQQTIRVPTQFALLQPETPDYFGEVPDQSQLQSGQNSCTAHAAIALMNYFYGMASQTAIVASSSQSQESIAFSSRFLYRMTRQLARKNGESLSDTGTSIRDTMKAMQLFGVPPEQYWPWAPDSSDEEPPPFCYAYAQKFQTTHYFRLDRPEIPGIRAEMNPETLLAQIKLVLAANFPIMFGLKISAEALEKATAEGQIAYEPFDQNSEIGHALVAVGYDDGYKIPASENGQVCYRGAIKIRNSWGNAWGDRGYGWLPYEYILKNQTTSWWSMIQADWVDTGKFGIESVFGARNSENQGGSGKGKGKG